MIKVTSKSSDQRGDSKVMSFGILIGAIVIFVLVWKVGGPFFAYLRFSQFVSKQVNYDRENNELDSTMLRRISDFTINEAKRLNLPVTDKDIKVIQEGDRAIVEVKYSEKADLFVTSFSMNFRVYKKSEGLGFK